MRVLAVSSQKGGSGKTTLAAHLAVEAERQGAGPVALIDTDPQGSLSNWWNARVSETPALVEADTEHLADACDKLRDAGAGLVIIDTPPAIIWTIVQVIKVADQIIIPVRPSPHDLVAAGTMVDLATEYGKPTVFVVNGATSQARITGQAAIALSQHGKVVPTITHNRTAFAASMTDGRTVMETAQSERAAEEIGKLWKYFAKQLDLNSPPESAEEPLDTRSDATWAGPAENNSGAVVQGSNAREENENSSQHRQGADLEEAKS